MQHSSNSDFEFVTYNSRGEEIVDPDVEAEARRIANGKRLDSTSAYGNPYMTYKDYNPGSAEDTGNIWGGLSAAERHMWQRVSAIRKAAYDEQHTDAIPDGISDDYWHRPSTSTLPPARQRSHAISPSPATKRPNPRRKGVTKRTPRSAPTMQFPPRPELSWQNHLSPHPSMSHFTSGSGGVSSAIPSHLGPYPAPQYQNSPLFPYSQTSEAGPSQAAFGTPYDYVQHPYHRTAPHPMQMDLQRLLGGQSNSMVSTDNLMSPYVYPNTGYQPQHSWTENAAAYPPLGNPHPSYVYPTSDGVHPQDRSREFQSDPEWQEEPQPQLEYGRGVDYEYSRERWRGD